MEENVLVKETTEIVEYNTERIKNLIYYIRGKQVMLDSDVAMLYHCETKYLNRVMKRNIDRFPEEFCFQLTENELENLRCQFVTSSLEKGSYGGRRYLPYAFTEQGIAMLSALLKSEVAVAVSIKIMNAFVDMRRYFSLNPMAKLELYEYRLDQHDKKFEEIFNMLENVHKQEVTKIFYDGQIYDSYSVIIDIIQSAKESIIMIDNYIDDTNLQMLSKKNKNVEVTIFTEHMFNIVKLDIEKFNKQYASLKVFRTKKFHDRFIIIDNNELYHCGASFKDLGKKCFAINKVEDEAILEGVLNKIKELNG